jgi:hypothetical protein
LLGYFAEPQKFLGCKYSEVNCLHWSSFAHCIILQKIKKHPLRRCVLKFYFQ